MRTLRRTSWLFVIALVGAMLLIPRPAVASPIWFDESNAGRGYASFSDLAAAYSGFLSPGNTVLDFGRLAEGTKLNDQLKADYGVSFLNAGGGRYDWCSGVRPESGANVEDLTGYDGSFMPSGKMVYLKFDNNVERTPFTIIFDEPVSQVGSFWAVGKEGMVHSLTISVFDSEQRLLGRKVGDSWLWGGKADRQNYESFFGLRTGKAEISRVEILNNSCTDFSNALVIDSVRFGRQLPEPITLALFAGGLLALRLHSRTVRR
ncbi:MAG TPA: hypothetical protein VMV94_11635 [Phycisphaerae bacterium]|nr:hypothetical protein [Phycisphaerae bacterium]